MSPIGFIDYVEKLIIFHVVLFGLKQLKEAIRTVQEGYYQISGNLGYLLGEASCFEHQEKMPHRKGMISLIVSLGSR